MTELGRSSTVKYVDNIREYLSRLEIPWEKIGEISTWVLLLSLIPGTAFGYVAEKSLPGQALYPVKRGIENIVLTIESTNPYTRSSYLQTLANNRVKETGTLVTQAVQTGDIQPDLFYSENSLQNITNTIQEEAATIQTIPDPMLKQQAETQLTVNIQNDQNQLQQMQTVLKQINPKTPDVNPTSVPSQVLLQQISQTQDTLQSITNTVSSQQTPSPTPTVIQIIPTPTVTPTPSPTPSLIPTKTPSHADENHRNNTSERQNNDSKH